MTVSDEAVEAAGAQWGRMTASQWSHTPDHMREAIRRDVRDMLEAAAPHMAPASPWVDAGTIHTADGRTFIGTDADGHIAMVRLNLRKTNAEWTMDDGRRWTPTRVMPLSALPEDTETDR